MRVHLEGEQAMERKIRETETRGTDAFQAACFLFEQDAMTAVLPLVPVDEGDLLGSRAVQRTWPIESGFYAPHAAAVHERPAVHRRGSWQFMRIGRSEAMTGAESLLQRHFERAFAAGLTLDNAPAQHPDKPEPGTVNRSSGRRERPRLAQRRRPSSTKRRR